MLRRGVYIRLSGPPMTLRQSVRRHSLYGAQKGLLFDACAAVGLSQQHYINVSGAYESSQRSGMALF